jgi:hypothetical protein
MINKILKIFGIFFASFFLIAGSSFAVTIDPTTAQNGSALFDNNGYFTNISCTVGTNYFSVYKPDGTSFGDWSGYSCGDLNVYGLTFLSTDGTNLTVDPSDLGTWTIIESLQYPTGENLSQAEADPYFVSEGTILITPMSQPATAVFSFTDRNTSNATVSDLSGILVPAVSSLWPIVLIIVGLILTFYVIEQTILIFQKSLAQDKETYKKYKKDVKKYK